MMRHCLRLSVKIGVRTKALWALLALGCYPQPEPETAACYCPPAPCPAAAPVSYAEPYAATYQGAGGPAPAAAGIAPAQPTLEARYHAAPALQVLNGLAAYYSDSLAGRPTASGEPYDPRALTAAHRTLPFGTVLRVIPAGGGPPVYVRVNDRGPFGDERRIVDVSRAAAERLGMIRAGVIGVRVEVLAFGTPKGAP